MKDNHSVIHLADYLEDSNKISIIDQRESDFSALLPKSNLIKRGFALTIDMAVIGLLYTGLVNGYSLFVAEFLGPINYQGQYDLIQGNLFFSLSVFIPLYFSYFLYCTFVMDGKTIGKMATGLKVIKEEFVHNMDVMEYELSLKDSFRRASGYLLCYMSFGIFFIFNFASEDKRGLPDYLSGSRTVSEKWLNQMLEQKAAMDEQVIIDISVLATDDKKAA